MKLLKDILYGVRIEEVSGPTNVAIESLTFDSRKATSYTMFVAIRGTQVDGHEYIQKALEKGVVAVVCEELPEDQPKGVTFIKVKDTKEALGIMASNYFDNPSENIKLVGVTGTNGKTTTVTLLYELFRKLGYKVGLISTVRNMIHNREIEATHTTPDALGLQRLIHDMVEAGCEYCFMEVSSHAVDQKRIAGLEFTGGVFTNITHEHLDYHGNFDNYIKAKKGFFDGLSSDAFALVNKDDVHAETMVEDTNASIRTMGIKSVADYRCKILENQFTGLQLNIDGRDVWTKLIGGFNAYNVLTCYAVAVLLNEDPMTVLTMISNIKSPEGRFEYVKSENGITAIVDYAHTPDALKNVLSTIKDIRTNNEMVITVVGCGGDRDKEKRPVMAQIACEYSDQVIFTSDNPRTEDPDLIINDMEKGVDPVHKKKTLAITSRKDAIKAACKMAHPGDILLIAGKGHEKYQEINGEVLPFDDLEVVNETFKALQK